MAATYRLLSKDTLFAPNKTMISVFNGTGSGRVVRIYRAWVLNNQVNAVTGVLTNLELRKLSAASGGTTLTPAKHDTASENVPAQILFATNSTVTPTALYKRVMWSTDEPAVNTLTIDELELIPAIACVWSKGYIDTTNEPITLREDEGFAIINTGASSGQCDIMLELTSMST